MSKRPRNFVEYTDHHCGKWKRRKLSSTDECNTNTKSDISPHSSSNNLITKVASQLFSDKNDQKQFKNIVVLIQESKLNQSCSNSSLDIIMQIAEFATGEWIDCCVCNESTSFLNINFQQHTSVQCFNCKSNNWDHFCEYHDKKCTSSEVNGSLCNDCDYKVCVKCFKTCKNCGNKTCIHCSANKSCEKCGLYICIACFMNNSRCRECSMIHFFEKLKQMDELLSTSDSD